ncbi:MAG: LAGLIDADG family homing endonuclease [Patescibacteria group bacterium]
MANNDNLISYEYIRGLVEGEGCFTFSSNLRKNKLGEKIKIKIPAFSIEMHERDEQLLNLVKNKLKLSNRVYNYKNIGKDRIERGRRAVLIVREFGTLKNIIIPLFYKKLKGHKNKQFFEWLENIGKYPEVPKSFKLLYQLHKCGFYDKNPRFLD